MLFRSAGILAGGCARTLPVTPGRAVARPPQGFTLTEHFGVAHPDQIVTFDLERPIAPAKTTVKMAAGGAAPVAVPFQLLNGGKQLAVRTSLAARETRTFTVEPGSPAPAAPNAVTVRETDAWYEIANGLTEIGRAHV